jgi:isoquinoline 1-oxidoreductase beta subunit
LKFRLEHLTGAPRLRRVLEFAGGQAGWHIPIPPGRGRGVALHQLKDTCVAQVAEVSVSDGRIRVHRIVCAVDCGQVINPEGVRAQIEGAIVFGLTATLRSAITIKAGRIEQGNFHDFQLLRLGETPEIAVHILPSEEPPGGVGEPGVPPVAPAVANAVFAVTGTRLRDLPLRI